MKEPARNKVRISLSNMVKNEASIIKMESSSPEAKKSSSNPQNDSDYGTSLLDNPNTKVKIEVQDDAPCSEDEGSVRPGCSLYTATFTKQELDIGPTELQPPDMHFMPQPCKPDPYCNKSLQIIKDFPQGQELPVLKRDEFTQQPDDDLFLQNSSGSLPQGNRGPMSQQDAQRVEIVSPPADADASEYITPIFVEFPSRTPKVPVLIVPQDSKHPEDLYSVTCNSHGENVCNNIPSLGFQCAHCKVSIFKANLLSHMRDHKHERSFQNITHVSQHKVAYVNSTYECDFCHKIFLQKSKLILHMNVHTRVLAYKSKSCDNKFVSSLSGRMRLYTNEKPFECKTCDKKFASRSILSGHKRKHSGKKPFECKTCYKKFRTKLALSVRKRVHSGQKPFKCLSCDKMFGQRSLLHRHMRVHAGEILFECGTCCKKFSRKENLISHMRTHTGEKPFECETCCKKFSHNATLISHMRMHTGEKPFKCKTCYKKFRTNSALSVHMRIHSGQKPFECETCCKKFPQNANLSRHMRTHTGEKPFECKTCCMKFTQNRNLINHTRMHSGEKPFKCETCCKKFTRNQTLIRHMRIHTGEKPFKCDTCCKKFTRNQALIRHMLIHTGEKPFECKTCYKKFCTHSELSRHMRVHII